MSNKKAKNEWGANSSPLQGHWLDGYGSPPMQSLTDEWKNGNPTGMTIPAIYLINRPADGERFVPAELGIWPQLWSYDKISIVVEFVLIPFRTLAFCRLSLVLSVFEKRAFDRCFQSLRGTARHWDAEPITIRFLSNRHTVSCVTSFCESVCFINIVRWFQYMWTFYS